MINCNQFACHSKVQFSINQTFSVQQDDALAEQRIREYLQSETLPCISDDLSPRGLEEMEALQKAAVQRLLESQDAELKYIREQAIKVIIIV